MILVTGGTGTIGGELVRLLREQQAAFRVLVRRRGQAEALAADGVEAVPGDLADPAALDAALKGCRTLFLLSSPAANQVELQLNAVQAAQRARLARLVKVSALGASANSPAKLGRDHWEIEEAIRGSGFAWTILRPHSFMQNLLGMAAAIAGKGECYGAAGNGKIAMVDARDVAAVAARVLLGDGHGGATYTLTGPHAISYGDAAAVLSDVLDTKVRYVDLAPDALRDALVHAGLAEWLAEDLVTLHTIYKAGHGAQVSDAVADLTGTAARDFTTFARDHAAAFRGGD